MREKTVYLSLGSNVGDREANLRVAIGELPHAGVAVTRVSLFYETEPVDLREQAWFLNCAVEVETHFEAIMLLRALREIEAKMGSRKLMAKGPRLIDMDIRLGNHRHAGIESAASENASAAVCVGTAGRNCTGSGAPEAEKDCEAVA